jgi:hypothetical protein
MAKLREYAAEQAALFNRGAVEPDAEKSSSGDHAGE